MAVLIALIRGHRPIARPARSATSGSTWFAPSLYILLPLSVLVADRADDAGRRPDPRRERERPRASRASNRSLARGPVASQIAIKQLGTNGGGFYNVNSAHPFEGGTPFGNYVENICILLIPAALTYTYGRMVGSVKQGWAIFSVMWVSDGRGARDDRARRAARPPRPCGPLDFGFGLEPRGQRGPVRARRFVPVGGPTTDASNGSVNHARLLAVPGDGRADVQPRRR